jgi:hypothetical protein
MFLVACGHVIPPTPDAADPCTATGICECRLDTDCAGVHTACDDQGTSRACSCVAGYAKNAGGACEWSGVVKDPGFASTTMWTIDGAAVIDNSVNQTGMVDPGAARWAAGDSLCKLSRVTQGIVMPRYSRAEPLVAQVSFQFSGRFDFLTPSVGFDNTYSEVQQTTGSPWRTARICLGGGQYAAETTSGLGAPVTLALMANRIGFECNTFSNLQVDHIEIVPANPNECPVPGQAANGDAEGTGGWVFNVTGGSGLSTGTFAPGAGEGSTKGARLFAAQRCDFPSMSDPISVPIAASVASPALSFYHRATNLSTTNVSLSGLSLPTLGGTGSGVTHRLCLPAFMRGAVVSLVASINTGSGTCTDAVNLETVFDNVKIINEPTCGTDPTITDPGFESPLDLVGATSVPGASLARTLADPQQAHSGNGVLQLTETSTCNDPTWQANVITPPSAGAAGPAVSFFYRAAPGSMTKFSVSSGFGAAFAPTQDSQWHQGLVCLNPALHGRNQGVAFSVRFQSGTCSVTIPAETAYVDDLMVTTDPSCAAM